MRGPFRYVPGIYGLDARPTQTGNAPTVAWKFTQNPFSGEKGSMW
jgi:hypothetical protein